MEKQKIVDVLKTYGVNDKVKGFDILVELLYMLSNDVEKGITNVKTYNIKNYYYKLSKQFDISVKTVPSNIRNAVTLKNIYGNGLKPKEIIEVVLNIVEKERGVD